MRIRIDKDKLQKSISAIEGIISARNAMTILANVLIEAANNKILLTTTDLEIGIRAILEGEIITEGRVTIPVKKFSSIIKSLSNEQVEIDVSANQMVSIQTTSKNVKFNLMGMEAKEFPYQVSIPEISLLEMDQKLFREMISKTYYAVANDETRFVFNGIFIETIDDKIRFVATDGRRLSFIQKEFKSDISLEEGLIIPSKVIGELQKILLSEGSIYFNTSNNQIFFKLNNVEISSRLILGKFPDYEKVIPASPKNEALIDKENFEEAVKRVSLMASDVSHQIKFKFKKNNLTIDAQTPDLGDAIEDLQIEYSSEETVIGFNSIYILDALREIESPKIRFRFTDSNLPSLILPADDDNYLCVVMPLKVT